MTRRVILIATILFSFLAGSNAQKVNKEKTITTASGYAPKGPISDMVLIYDGGSHRKETWTEEQFKPYVYAPDQNGGKANWTFDGFLFLEIYDGDRCGFASGYRPVPAKKEDWLKLIDGYFISGKSIRALDNCIENAKKECGKLTKKRKVVISLPEPIPNQKDWGELNGKKMDFSVDEDRIASCKWYIDYIIESFKKAKLKNVELGGFYWLAEEATNTRTFVMQVSDYIHEKDQRFYWIPYFKSDGYSTWKELGFDQAYLQPNHFFNDDIPDSRIDEACALARQYGMSMEMEFDERATKDKRRRLHAYIDGFRQNKVFEETDIAYYQGGIGLYSLWKGSKEDVDLYYKLINIIIERQKKK
jgi:hypothetical protein